MPKNRATPFLTHDVLPPLILLTLLLLLLLLVLVMVDFSVADGREVATVDDVVDVTTKM